MHAYLLQKNVFWLFFLWDDLSTYGIVWSYCSVGWGLFRVHSFGDNLTSVRYNGFNNAVATTMQWLWSSSALHFVDCVDWLVAIVCIVIVIVRFQVRLRGRVKGETFLASMLMMWWTYSMARLNPPCADVIAIAWKIILTGLWCCFVLPCQLASSLTSRFDLQAMSINYTV